MSVSVSQDAIENALIAKYSGYTMNVGGVPTEVQVFLERPSNELVSGRVFPSVSLMYMGETDDLGIRENLDDTDEEVGQDDSVSPSELLMRVTADPMLIRYSVDTWHIARAIEDQQLYDEMLRRRTKTRGYLRVLSIDGVYIDLWMFKVGGSLSVHDYVDNDMMVYHKSATVEIPAYLTFVAPEDVVREKVVEEIHVDVQSQGVVLGADGRVASIDESRNTTDVVLVITDGGETGI